MLKNLEARAKAILGEDATESLKETSNNLLDLTAPNNWNIHIEGNAAIQMDSDFEMLMISVGSQTNEDLERISIKKFYYLLNFLKEKNKQ